MAKGKKGNSNAQQPANSGGNQEKKGQQAQPSQAQIDKNK